MITPDRISSSPFFYSSPPRGIGVVIHSTRSGTSMNPSELEGTLNWFRNPQAQVSSHWVIGRRGEKVRVIPDTLQAWHAGEHNATHWGIELEQGVEGDGFPDVQIEALVAICKGYVEDFGIPPAHAPSAAVRGFIGHQETTQGISVGKSDPGRLFPWEWFISLLSPQPVGPDPKDVALACISAAHFVRMGWRLGDLIEPEKEILRWLARQV